jgi:ApaG protein
MSTNNTPIEVDVKVTYLPRQSQPDSGHFTFAYTITIHNHGEAPVQLLRRHWRITDGDHQVQEVHGDGVVGQQPVIAAGEQFRYTSGATLPTPLGCMEGSYEMRGENEALFEVPIPMFSLRAPHVVH